MNPLPALPSLYFKVDYCCIKQSHSVTKVITKKLSLIVHLNYPALINLEESPIAPQHIHL